MVVIKVDFFSFFNARSEKVPQDREGGRDTVWQSVYLSDIRQLQDVREDIEAWGLQQRADSLGQCRAWQRQELLHLHLMPGDKGETGSRLDTGTTERHMSYIESMINIKEISLLSPGLCYFIIVVENAI